ncbi:MAG: SipW-dependent-type signal peptide-containing protein [Lachnospiraceae bacterium]
MNKKKLVTMVASLAMVAVIGVGATLAYMSDTTDKKTNTFTVGKVEASLVEKTNGDKEWDDTTDGKNMYPGQIVEKKPIMTIAAGSADCYAFLQVTGADALVAAGFTMDTFSSDWEKTFTGNTLDGIYVYKDKVVKAEMATALPAIFTQVTYDADNGNGVTSTVGTVNVAGCAVQAEGLTQDGALAQATFK